MRTLTLLVAALLLLALQAQQMRITNTAVLDDPAHADVFVNGELSSIYNDTVYNTATNCRSGDLIIIDSNKGTLLSFSCLGFPALNAFNTYLALSPNQEPAPAITFIDTSNFNINFNCPATINNTNYFNKVDIYLPGVQHASFLLNCDPKGRHKPFEYGYLILTVINAVIIVGVAMHSHIWSIKWRGLPLSLELKWIPFAIFNVISILLLVALTFFAVSNFSSAFETLRYVGIWAAAAFVFICFNETFFLIKKMKGKVYGVLRWCDLASIGCTIALMTISALFESWILYNVLATCICVGCIKLLYFNNLFQAFLSMGIYVLNVTSIAIALHYILPSDRSYNDYATELSSPLFFEVPDLINSLFKKCSWLVVADVIVPGVMLSYLRMYDENRSSRFGGVYTVWGNITFVVSTAVWIGLEAVYPFSIPFCLVTYLFLMLVIFLIALKRNDWKTLWEGTFQKFQSVLAEDLVKEQGNRFSAMMDGVMEPLKKSVGKESNERSRDSLN